MLTGGAEFTFSTKASDGVTFHEASAEVKFILENILDTMLNTDFRQSSFRDLQHSKVIIPV